MERDSWIDLSSERRSLFRTWRNEDIGIQGCCKPDDVIEAEEKIGFSEVTQGLGLQIKSFKDSVLVLER